MGTMPQPALPADDLYLRLGVPTDASPEAIELAWRALLRRHHPDVAGPDGLEQAKRINVAHDWLSDPALRARYDREHGLRHVMGPRGDGHRAWHARDAGGAPPARPAPAPRRPDQATVVARFLERVAALTHTEIDRLALAEPPPIAFGATIRRFLPPEQRAALDEVERAVATRLPPGADRPTIRDAIDGYATELVLGRFLDELLTEPFRERAHERLTRGWDAAVGQPRYGPNGASVEGLVERIARLDAAGLRRLTATGAEVRGTEDPWPPDVSPDDDDALRISAILAARDAAAAVPAGLSAPDRARARLGAGRLAHLLVLRHAFAPAAFEALSGPWRPWLLAAGPGPRVRRPAGGR
jgi:curved DNA-binding protein CbpA